MAADQLSLEARSNEAADANKKIIGDLKKYSGDVEAAKKDLQDKKKQIKTEIENIRISGSEAEGKLVIIKTLRDIITDELLADSNTKASSFVQLQTFNDKLHELKVLLENSHDTMYSGLVTTLLTLAETKGFSDQKILRQILDVLKKLETSLVEFRKKQDTEGKTNIKTMKQQAKEKINQIKSLAKLITNAKSNQIDNENIIKSSAKSVAMLKAEIARKNGESAFWNKLCLFQDGLKKSAHEFKKNMTDKFRDVSSKLLELK